MVFHEGTGTAVALADCAQNVTPCEFMSPGKVDRIVERRGLLQLIPQKRPSREKSRVDGNRSKKKMGIDYTRHASKEGATAD